MAWKGGGGVMPSIVLPSPRPVVSTSNNTANAPAGAPIGIRNNNPGNIRPPLIAFKGQAGVNGGFAIFSSPVYGVRALFKLLQTYQNSHKLNTIVKIGNRWAPPSENVTAHWVNNVASLSGIAASAPLNARDFNVQAALARGIIGAENGQKWMAHYPASMFSQAWGMI